MPAAKAVDPASIVGLRAITGVVFNGSPNNFLWRWNNSLTSGVAFSSVIPTTLAIKDLSRSFVCECVVGLRYSSPPSLPVRSTGRRDAAGQAADTDGANHRTLFHDHFVTI